MAIVSVSNPFLTFNSPNQLRFSR